MPLFKYNKQINAFGPKKIEIIKNYDRQKKKKKTKIKN